MINPVRRADPLIINLFNYLINYLPIKANIIKIIKKHAREK